MSLVAWFPLNNNFNNNGSDFINLTNTSAAWGTGKITPSCLQLNSTATNWGTIPSLVGGKVFSIAFWFKGDSSATASAWADLWNFNTTNGSATTSLRVEITADATGTGNINLFNNGHWSGSGGFCSMTFDTTWHHYIYVADSTTVYGYKDGVLIGSTAKQNIDLVSLVGTFRLGDTEASKGYINDFRVYSHALSTKEIAELVKGLAIHYAINFEDLYTPIEYLESSGTQYIDTGIYLTRSHELEMKASWLSYTAYDTLIGSRGGADYFIRLYGSIDVKSITWGGTYQACGSATAGQVFTIKTSTDSSYVKTVTFDATSYTLSPANTDAVRTAFLFGINSGSLYRPATARIYYCKIYNNGIVVRDFIPCLRNYDSKPGMYDLVNNVFYTNAGTGEFTYPDVAVTSTLPDNSGYGNNAAMVNMTTIETTSLGNAALNTTGTNSYFFCNSSLTYEAYTLAVWFKLGAEAKMPFGYGWTRYCYGDMSWKYNADSDGELYYNHEGGAISTSNYVFWVATWDGTTVKIYRNGVFEGSAAATGLSLTPLYIANNNITDYSTANSYVADVKIFTTALSQSDIQDLYKTRAIIDNTANLYCSSFNEKETDPELPNSTGIVKVETAMEEIYQSLPYLRSTGTQYIDTGLTISSYSNIKLVIDGKFNTIPSSDNLMGAYTGARFHFGISGSSFHPGIHDAYTWVGADTSRHTFTLDASNNTFKIDDTSYSLSASSTSLPAVTLTLFAEHRSDSPEINYYCSDFYMYSCQVYNGTTLLRDYIPYVDKQSGLAGLLDKVNLKFYSSSGTGVFPIDSPETLAMNLCCEKLDYIEANGAQCINTGVAYEAGQRFEQDIMFTSAATRGLMGFNGNTGTYWGMNTDGYIEMEGATSVIGLNEKHNIVYYPGSTLYIDGTLVKTATATSFSGNYTLFDLNVNGYRCSARLYGCKVYNSANTLIRDYVPFKVNGVIGLFDKANSMFYGNDGSSTFIAGNILDKFSTLKIQNLIEM